MRLSVVIPTLNEQANIGACVESAFALAAGWGEPVELIVADGRSDDDTRDAARVAGATVVDSERGRGRQLRSGIDAATGEVVLMLHADARIDSAAGRQLADAVVNDGVACGAFRQRIEAEGRVYRWLESGNAWRARRLGAPYGDQAIFARRDLLDRAGGVRDLPLMEDVDLMRRLREHAWPVLLDGPVYVSARRWRRHGVIGQTLRNWSLLAAYQAGVSPEWLARRYKPDAT